MADISQLTTPEGNTYDIKDANARTRIEILEGAGGATAYAGVAVCPSGESWTLNSSTGLYSADVTLNAHVAATSKVFVTPIITATDRNVGYAQQAAWDTHFCPAIPHAGGITFYAVDPPQLAVEFMWGAYS